MNKLANIIEVAVITAAHGIRGQVKIHSLTDNPKDIVTYGELTDATGKKQFKIKLQGGTDKAIIAAIEGVTDRNAAELLKGTVLYACADNVKTNPRNALVGMEARTADGNHYGSVISAHNFGAGDIIEIEKPDGKTEMLPLNEKFVKIDGKKNFVIIYPPEYVEASSSRAAKRRGDPET